MMFEFETLLPLLDKRITIRQIDIETLKDKGLDVTGKLVIIEQTLGGNLELTIQEDSVNFDLGPSKVTLNYDGEYRFTVYGETPIRKKAEPYTVGG